MVRFMNGLKGWIAVRARRGEEEFVPMTEPGTPIFDLEVIVGAIQPFIQLRSDESVGETSPQRSLPLIFAFAKALQDSEAGFLGVADGHRLEFGGRVETRYHPADRLLAGRTCRQFRSADRAAQCEPPAARGAIPLTKFVFVKRHSFAIRLAS